MIHIRFSNNGVKHLSTWKMSTSEFLLPNKIKKHNKSYKKYESTNLVIIPNGVSVWFWNLSKNQTFPEPKDEYDETILLWFTSKLDNCYLWMIRYEFFYKFLWTFLTK